MMNRDSVDAVSAEKQNGGRRQRAVCLALLPLLLAAAGVVGLTSCSTPKRGDVRVNPKDDLRYSWIPAGSYQAGCSKFDEECSPEEKPGHEVTISKGFWLSQTEVTVEAYRRFSSATHRPMPPDAVFGGQQLNAGWADGKMPIVNVDWNDSQAYCQWIGGNLPTEAQWEYAARGGNTGGRYGTLSEIAWFGDNTGVERIDTAKLLREDAPGFLYHLSRNKNGFHPTGLKAPNPYGLYDMLGNVWEWTGDWFSDQYYRGIEHTDPAGPPNGSERVLRGGSWTNAPSVIRFSSRGRRQPAARSIDTGFRCAW